MSSIGVPVALTDALLYAEITTDPAALGYATAGFSGDGDDQAIADLINAVSTNFQLPVGQIPRTDFMALVTGVIIAVANSATTNPTIYAKWTWLINNLMTPAEWIIVSSSQVQGLLAEMVSDGLTTTETVTAISNYNVSRAQFLWGANVNISHLDVGRVKLPTAQGGQS